MQPHGRYVIQESASLSLSASSLSSPHPTTSLGRETRTKPLPTPHLIYAIPLRWNIGGTRIFTNMYEYVRICSNMHRALSSHCLSLHLADDGAALRPGTRHMYWHWHWHSCLFIVLMSSAFRARAPLRQESTLAIPTTATNLPQSTIKSASFESSNCLLLDDGGEDRQSCTRIVSHMPSLQR